MKQEVRDRRSDEVEAMQAYYGNALSSSILPLVSSKEDNEIPLEGPWFIQIIDIDDDTADNTTSNNSSLGIPTLEIRLPSSYPLGEQCPEPFLHNIMMNPQSKERLFEEMKDMYEADVDVGIMWCERCREELMHGDIKGVDNNNDSNCTTDEQYNANDRTQDDTTTNQMDNGDITTFIATTTRFGQPRRNFPTDVITNKYYQRDIVHTKAFRPPKSGSSEIMIAHVASVTCAEHVQWVLAELLLNDKKIGKASHNMFAYRFINDSGTMISDCDDDGEKGSGAKLSSLLDMCKVDNVLVVVSRWYGGIHLGSARFKWIASVARDGLVQGGYLER